MNFSFSKLKLPNKEMEKYFKNIFFIDFHSIPFSPPRQGLRFIFPKKKKRFQIKTEKPKAESKVHKRQRSKAHKRQRLIQRAQLKPKAQIKCPNNLTYNLNSPPHTHTKIPNIKVFVSNLILPLSHGP